MTLQAWVNAYSMCQEEGADLIGTSVIAACGLDAAPLAVADCSVASMNEMLGECSLADAATLLSWPICCGISGTSVKVHACDIYSPRCVLRGTWPRKRPPPIPPSYRGLRGFPTSVHTRLRGPLHAHLLPVPDPFMQQVGWPTTFL